MLFARGYLIDPGGREPNEWRDDPPLGLVRLKGVALKGEGEEAEPDPRITFSIAELWSIDRVEDAYREQGHWLAGYAYHGQVGDVSLRYCFDPERHPEMPYHRHTLGGKAREPWRRVSAGEIDGSARRSSSASLASSDPPTSRRGSTSPWTYSMTTSPSSASPPVTTGRWLV